MTDRRVSAARALEQRAADALRALRAKRSRLSAEATPDLASCPPALVAAYYRSASTRAVALEKVEADIAGARADLRQAIAKRRAVETIVESEETARRTARRRRIARTPDSDA